MNMLKVGLVVALVIFSAMACGTGQDNLPVVTAYNSCPANSVLANATDVLTIPSDDSKTVPSPSGSPFPGGFIVETPLIFTVEDSTGIPKNNVCLTFLTDGFWFADSGYSIPIAGVGAGNQISVVTDDTGKATVYWESELLPAAAPISFATGTAAPGKDQSGQSFIQVYTGVKTGVFNLNWTVQGEQLP